MQEATNLQMKKSNLMQLEAKSKKNNVTSASETDIISTS
jgi:hypothetical protein